MTTKNDKLSRIQKLSGEAMAILPENVVLTGDGVFRGAISPTVRDTTISKERIIYALHEVRGLLESIYTVSIS